ncbi:MAG: class I SAM-dependent methyltransferase [Desulfobacteraceae bacterium]|nr:class I SAM-dependent methyltransferase [Desulfobacteraceae bacterium]
MKLNWAELLVVNNPSRVFQQRIEIGWMRKRMPLPPGGVFLEIGCGRGAGASIIRKEFSPSVMCASDLDFMMIRRAMKYLAPEEARGVAFLTADALHLPHPDGVFDAVFGFGVLHHVPAWQGALSEIGRVIKPGGVYFLEEIYPPLYQNILTKHILLHPAENRFRSPELKQALDLTGFTPVASLEHKFFGILAVLRKER